MRSDLIKYYFFGVVAVIAQILLFRHLTFYGAQADIVLVFLLWSCLHRVRGEVLLLTAVIAFLQDSLLDLWGLHMFTKTITVFLVHAYVNRSRDNQPLIWQVFLGIFAISFIHNIVFLALSSFVELYATEYIFFQFIFGASFYTAIAGTAVYSLTKN